MFFKIGNNLPKQMIQLIEREDKIISEMKVMNEKFETAVNLQNSDALHSLDKEAEQLNNRFRQLIAEKTIVMTITISRNQNFIYN